MTEEYTLDIARKYGKPPAVKIIKRRKQTYYQHANNPKDRYIQMYIDPDDWYGYPDTTFVHEFAHWKHDMALLSKKITLSDVKSLADIEAQKIRDWIELQRKSEDQSDLLLFETDPTEFFSRKLFEDSYWNIGNRERFISTAYADTVGNLTNGEYGGGHTPAYYKRVNNSNMCYCEAIANIKLIKKYGKNIGDAFEFNNVWDILKIIGE